MSFEKDSSSAQLLQYIKHEIRKAGAMGEIAVRIGTRRGWRTHRDPAKQQQRWELNAWQLLDPFGRSTWSLLDHLDACEVLGFDPLRCERAAA